HAQRLHGRQLHDGSHRRPRLQGRHSRLFARQPASPCRPELMSTAKQNAARRARKAPKKITESYLHNSGLHYVQRFSTGTENFRRVMMRKVDRSCRHHKDQSREHCAAMVEALIEKFARAGLLNDADYTRATVATLR